MKVISVSGNSKPRLKSTSAAIGIFDGVHRGHQYLIEHMLKAARRLKAVPIVITFFPHPAHVLRPDIKLGLITSLDDRFRLLGAMGVKMIVVVPFSRVFARIQPEKFIADVLVKQLGVKAVFIGEDFRFGKDRSGGIELFKKLGVPLGYETHAMKALNADGSPVSSTRIRQLIMEGQLKKAAGLLGRDVFVSGQVVKGSQRGKKLGFPTANIDYEADVLPPQGVYVVRVIIDGKTYPGMANLGTRPSFGNGTLAPILEVHILDFAKNIYGKHVTVEFLQKIRSEKKFSSPQELIAQIKKDEVTARNLQIIKNM